MRRDLCYFYPLPVEPVFDAFVQAANQKFGKNCKLDAYKTISFGLDYSFRYNMNGGALTIHFMPYNNGTAIDMHYTVVQAFGARYQKHADDVLIFVNAALQAQAQPIKLDINQFIAYEAEVPAAPVNPVPQNTAAPQPPQPQAAPVQQFCTNCGARLAPNANFCMNCGAKIG